ncbi:hypothetical protein D3C87_502980 [compost metagenome]
MWQKTALTRIEKRAALQEARVQARKERLKDILSPSTKKAVPHKAFSSAKVERRPIDNFATAVADFGQVLGKPVPESELGKVFDKIAMDSLDLFGDRAAARRFLDEAPIDGKRNAREVATSQGIGRILMRLEALRFGATG